MSKLNFLACASRVFMLCFGLATATPFFGGVGLAQTTTPTVDPSQINAPAESDLVNGPFVKDGEVSDVEGFAKHWGYDAPALKNYSEFMEDTDAGSLNDLGTNINQRIKENPETGKKLAKELANAKTWQEVAASSVKVLIQKDPGTDGQEKLQQAPVTSDKGKTNITEPPMQTSAADDDANRPSENDLVNGPFVKEGYVTDIEAFAYHWRYNLPALANYSEDMDDKSAKSLNDLGLHIRKRVKENKESGGKLAEEIVIAESWQEFAASIRDAKKGAEQTTTARESPSAMAAEVSDQSSGGNGDPSEDDLMNGPYVKDGKVTDVAAFARHWGYNTPALLTMARIFQNASVLGSTGEMLKNLTLRYPVLGIHYGNAIANVKNASDLQSLNMLLVVASMSTDEASKSDVDPKRSSEIGTVLQTLPEFLAVKRILIGAAPTLEKMPLPDGFMDDVNHYEKKLSEDLAKKEYKEHSTLSSNQILKALKENAEGFLPKAGCFVALKEHPSLQDQWRALAPLLSVEYTTLKNWQNFEGEVEKVCSAALLLSSIKPQQTQLWSAGAYFERGVQSGMSHLAGC